MPRVRVPLQIIAERDEEFGNQLRVSLHEDLDGSQESQAALQALQARILSEGSKIVILDARPVRVNSEGAEAWIAFANALPSHVQVVYASCQLSLIVNGEPTYRPGHLNDVHLEPGC